MRPPPLLTQRQANEVDALKRLSPTFAAMRNLAMRFRGILHGGGTEKLDRWIEGARRFGIHAMRIFARSLSRDIEAVEAAVTMAWSNGQTEGQINRLKTLKRVMYGRAKVDLLRARMLPEAELHVHHD